MVILLLVWVVGLIHGLITGHWYGFGSITAVLAFVFGVGWLMSRGRDFDHGSEDDPGPMDL